MLHTTRLSLVPSGLNAISPVLSVLNMRESLYVQWFRTESTGLIVIRPESTGLIVFRPEGMGLIVFRPEGTGLIVFGPEGTGLFVFRPGASCQGAPLPADAQASPGGGTLFSRK